MIPRTPWLNANPMLKPTLLLTAEKDFVFAKWQHKQVDQVYHWILYCNYGGEWSYEIFDPSVTAKQLAKSKNGKKLQYVAVKAVDRLSNESPYMAEKIK
ncbi:hypothetical protein [Sphingobacterium sp. IITKGP-BTPF85]|uniref:hypothetical protein n=1 Tax=Sphingobacterium sp. IITKGP-BTPF85 TaxID=1338009 RepID=UPI00040EC01E|nr:hypothetical protein [Sphingobacterium sp. IITKGP-BTPF85]